MADAYTTALTLLSRRELSTRQLRDRLERRHFEPGEIDAVITRLGIHLYIFVTSGCE